MPIVKRLEVIKLLIVLPEMLPNKPLIPPEATSAPPCVTALPLTIAANYLPASIIVFLKVYDPSSSLALAKNVSKPKTFPKSYPIGELAALLALGTIQSKPILPSFKAFKAIATLAIELNIPPPRASVILLIVVKMKVRVSTAPLTKASSARPIVNKSQAFLSLFSLASNESKVFSNYFYEAPALLFAALTSSIVRS